MLLCVFIMCPWRTEEGVGPLELEQQAIVSCLTWYWKQSQVFACAASTWEGAEPALQSQVFSLYSHLFLFVLFLNKNKSYLI